MNSLQIRLKNCIETILDLRPCMRKLYQTSFAEDFSRLETFAEKIDAMSLKEDEVERLEEMTAAFIRQARFSGGRLVAPARRLQ